ncbi:MAG: M67 family peptidase [Alphaproteobacteria bacterium]|nr:M67 family peptidase [Alphaproteobacteria bacterium]
MTAAIEIAAADLAACAARACAAYPDEACALLEGVRDRAMVRVARVHFSDNVASDRRQRFEVDPRTLLRLHRTLRDGDTAIVGLWHSHPNGKAAPSATDFSQAYDPDLAWIITAVTDSGAGEARAFRVGADAFAEILLRAPS